MLIHPRTCMHTCTKPPYTHHVHPNKHTHICTLPTHPHTHTHTPANISTLPTCITTPTHNNMIFQNISIFKVGPNIIFCWEISVWPWKKNVFLQSMLINYFMETYKDRRIYSSHLFCRFNWFFFWIFQLILYMAIHFAVNMKK